MLIIDPDDGAIMDANQSACEFYGYDPEEFRKKRIQEINQLSETEVNLEMQEARAENRSFFKFIHAMADGTLKNVEVTSGPITLDEKQYLYSVIRDVSTMHQVERNAIVLQESLNALIRQQAVFTAVFDPELQPVNYDHKDSELFMHPLYDHTLDRICGENIGASEFDEYGKLSGYRFLKRFVHKPLGTEVYYQMKLYKMEKNYLLVAEDINERHKLREIKEEKDLLGDGLDRVKKFEGIVAICSYCEKIRNQSNIWMSILEYLDVPEFRFSHGICPDCDKKHFTSN